MPPPHPPHAQERVEMYEEYEAQQRELEKEEIAKRAWAQQIHREQ